MDLETTSEDVHGPILGLDLGEKRIGAAISDELMISVRRLEQFERTNWKQLVTDVRTLIERFDAKCLVIGLPLRLNQETGSQAEEIKRLAHNLQLSLPVPVYLQDEKLSSVEARERLISEGKTGQEISAVLDSEAAAIIVEDFINSFQRKTNSQ